MNNLLKINFPKRKLSSVLGLALDGNRLDGVVLRRTNGSAHVQQAFSVTLSLDPLTADVELVGREIRNQLGAAGIRERDCVIGLPLKWALVAHTELPDLAETDVPEFLQIEAERGFHSDVETLLFGASRFRSETKQYATLVGIPRANIAQLELALRAAKLKPRSFSLGITALQMPGRDSSSGVLALAIGENNVRLQITCGGGVAALRTLEGALETEAARRVLDAEVIAREARITLGELPEELRGSIRTARVFGPRELARQLADELELKLKPMGFAVEVVKNYPADEFSVHLPPDAPVSEALSLAAGRLAGCEAAFEFLPPHVPAWKQLAARYGSGKYRTAAAAASVVVGIGAAVFLFQQWQIMRLQSQWDAIAPRVTDLQALQDKVREFQPWYDESLDGLEILKQLTTAFPEDGAVSAKTLEIRDLNTVTCSGVARDNQALLRVLGELRAKEGVADVKVDQLRGRSPMQFTFDFHWNGGANAD